LVQWCGGLPRIADGNEPDARNIRRLVFCKNELHDAQRLQSELSHAAAPLLKYH
jgi:hypothetical protein